ncbi:MAG: hypothetical protein H6744_03530 [Deltaproteobacteria bacterium]|nr:hypothetical protein [Deltaproteobacteria bacterium]MCB9785748.1 hypothetical protein [Deltaproteobacteria bacterium]
MTHRRTLAISLALSAAALTAGVASARPHVPAPAPIPSTQATLRAALERAKFDIRSERVTITKKGRRDLTLMSPTPAKKVIERLQTAFRTSSDIGGQARVIGYAKLTQSKTWTFTLARGDKHYVVEVAADGKGSRIAIWGAAYEAHGYGAPDLPLPAPKLPAPSKGTLEQS